jgi:hypothetical protein
MVTCWTSLVFKVRATSILKSRENSMEKGVNQTDHANRAPAHDVAPGHDTSAASPYAPYPRRARTPRCRSVQRSMHCAGGLLCKTSMAAGMVPSGEATLADAPPAARQWPPGQPHVAEHYRPHRACSDHRGGPTSSQPTSHDYIDKSPTAPRARPTAARAPPPAIGIPSVSLLLRPLPWLSEHAETSSLYTSSLHACVLA